MTGVAATKASRSPPRRRGQKAKGGSAIPAVGEGKATVDRILDSAEAVLRQHGYAGFTTRRVAEAAGMTPGNLTYHFPTKVKLVRAMISRLVARYSERMQTLLRQGPHLEAVIRWFMADAVAEDTVRLFRELWAMSLHDRVVRDAVDDLYDEVLDRIASALQRDHPSVDPGTIREIVQFLSLMTEGSTVVYGTHRERIVGHEQMVEFALRVVRWLAPDLLRRRADELLADL